jgi:hypothetical protein
MTKDKALKLALEAFNDRTSLMKWQMARDAVKEALMSVPDGAQPEQEPWSNVGIGVDVTKEGVSVVGIYKLSNDSSHLFYSQFYTTPPPVAPPHKRKPLTEQEIGAILEDINAFGTRLYTFARAIEAAHGIKGEA